MQNELHNQARTQKWFPRSRTWSEKRWASCFESRHLFGGERGGKQVVARAPERWRSCGEIGWLHRLHSTRGDTYQARGQEELPQ